MRLSGQMRERSAADHAELHRYQTADAGQRGIRVRNRHLSLSARLRVCLLLLLGLPPAARPFRLRSRSPTSRPSPRAGD